MTGTADAEDRVAMDLAIETENTRRAGLTPPLPLLPNTTAVERRTSYAATLLPRVQATHAANIEKAIEVSAATPSFATLRKSWSQATPAQQAAMIAAGPPV